jgi:hypothetical protein
MADSNESVRRIPPRTPASQPNVNMPHPPAANIWRYSLMPDATTAATHERDYKGAF